MGTANPNSLSLSSQFVPSMCAQLKCKHQPSPNKLKEKKRNTQGCVDVNRSCCFHCVWTLTGCCFHLVMDGRIPGPSEIARSFPNSSSCCILFVSVFIKTGHQQQIGKRKLVRIERRKSLSVCGGVKEDDTSPLHCGRDDCNAPSRSYTRRFYWAVPGKKKRK